MKKVKWMVILIAIVLMLSGVVYAAWSEQIQLVFNAKTAFTELSILEVQTDNLSVDTTTQSQATIRVKNIEEKGEATADIVFINTGSIPLVFKNILISSVSGYSEGNKNRIFLDVCAHAGEKAIFDDSHTITYWKSNGSVKYKGSLTEIPVGDTVTVRIKVRFDKHSQNEQDKDNGNIQSKPQVLENVTFVLKPEYARFNVK